jgi:hypothetical protein
MAAVETRDTYVRLALAVRRDNDMRKIMSTGESLAIALLLNRHDWLNEMGFTMVGAFDRVGPRLVTQLREVERVLHNTADHPEGREAKSSLHDGGTPTAISPARNP